jgi:acetyltransferase-like isoleucine patch superfamily enzyme
MMAEAKEIASAGREAVGRIRVRRRLLAAAAGIRMDRTVDVRSPDRLLLGPRVVVDRGVVLHCGGMDWSPPGGGISLGANCYLGPNCVLFGAGGIEIGEAALISPGVVITSHQHSFRRSDQDIRHQPLRFDRVVVGRDVWIGANATILPGVHVGPGSVIGAGAVVTNDIPPGVVALGVPARVSSER